MRNILISGINGFVGSNLSVYLFNKGYDIYSLSRTPLLVKERINFVWDNLDEIKNSPTDAIVHLAGKAHDLKNTSNSTAYFEANYQKSKELFDLFLDSEISDFIYFSSVKAVADTVTGILDEGAEPRPLTPYGQSKQKAEAYLLSKKLPKGKRLFIIRPCMIHGPGNKGNLNLLFKIVEKGMPWPLAAFDNQRSFLSIGNLNFIIEKLLADRAIPGGVYNLADDEPLSTNRLIEAIAEAINRRPKFWKLNKRLVKTCARLGDLLYLPLNSERLKKLTESYAVANLKIKAALGIKQLPVSSKEGIITTIKSFQEHTS